MTITTVFDPPLPTDTTAVFDTKAFGVVADLNDWSTEANALAVDVNADAAAADASATAADASEAAALASELAAELAAQTVINAPGSGGTSTTSNSIPTSGLPVSKSFTTQAGKNFGIGMTLKVASTASITNWIMLEVVSYDNGTGALVGNATHSNGSGTFTAWSLSLSAPIMTTTNNSVQAKSGNFTSYVADRGSEFICSAALTNTLSAAATLGNGWYQYITNDSSSTVTIARSGSETFTGPAGTAATSLSVGKGMCYLILCDGANFRVFRIGSVCPVLHVREQQSTGVQGGTSVAADFTQTRVLNTTVTNTIPGASLASNEITLPAGTYEVWAKAPAWAVNGAKAALYNTTDSTYTIIGSTVYIAADVSGDSWILGQFTIAAAKAFKIRHYTQAAFATSGLGQASASGQVEVYTEVFIKQVA